MTTAYAKTLPVIIVGAGFNRTLLAVYLMRLGVDMVLFERDERQLAKGLAFGTRRPEHLLDVRACNMSALPDDLGHFLRHMGFAAKEKANRFVPRLAYGHYLCDLLVDAMAAAPERARIVQAEAIAASRSTPRACRKTGCSRSGRSPRVRLGRQSRCATFAGRSGISPATSAMRIG